MYCCLPRQAIDSRCAIVTNLPDAVSRAATDQSSISTYLEVALHVEEQVLRFYVSMGNTLTMKIRNAGQDLLEAALDLAR